MGGAIAAQSVQQRRAAHPDLTVSIIEQTFGSFFTPGGNNVATQRRKNIVPEETKIGDFKRGFIALVIGGLFNTGYVFSEFRKVQANQEDAKLLLAAQVVKMAEIREKQIVGLQDIEALKGVTKNLDGRVLIIERVLIDRSFAGTK